MDYMKETLQADPPSSLIRDGSSISPYCKLMSDACVKHSPKIYHPTDNGGDY